MSILISLTAVLTHTPHISARDIDLPPAPLPVAAPTTTQGPAQVGEYEQVDLNIRYDDQATWRHVIHYPDAAYIKLHFTDLQLAPGDQLTIANPSGTLVHRYPSAGTTTDGKAGFWALSIVGDTAVVILERHVTAETGIDSPYYQAALNGTAVSNLKIHIDKYARGYPEGFIDSTPSLSSTCGGLERTDVACYEDSHPTEFNRSHAVVRLLKNGDTHCTGWRVTPDNLLITNEHCITSQSELEQIEFWFGYQRPLCESGNTATPTIITGNTLLLDNTTLDFALVTLNNFASIQSYGYLELDPRVPTVGEEIYIPQHGAGNPKEFGIESDVNTPNGICQVDMNIADGSGTNTDIGYLCDTIGGSSGSPVLSRQTHRVIALHHLGNASAPNCSASSSSSLNRGARIELILPLIEPHLPPALTLAVTPNTPREVCLPALLNYQATVGSIAGFNAAVTLNAQNLPSGMTATFDTNSQSPTFTSTLTISSTETAVSGLYNIDVVASTLTDTFTSTIALTLFDGLPTLPTPSSPANGATNQATSPTLSWNTIAAASGYEVEVATDAAFNTIVYSATTTINNHAVGIPLNRNTIYYWRVRASNLCGTGSDSITYTFTTQSKSLSCNGATVNFEASIPDDWSLEDNGGNFGWTRTGEADCSGSFWSGSNLTPGSGQAACVDVDSNNSAGANYDAEMQTNSFSLVAQTAVTLTYAATYNEVNGSIFDVDITTNNGITWTNLSRWQEDHSSEWVSLDLTSYIGEADVAMRYRYYGDDWDWYALVDEVSLNCHPCPTPTAVSDLTLTPSGNDLILNWTATDADSYAVYRATNDPYTTGTYLGTATNTFTDVGAHGTLHSNYTYTIMAQNSCGSTPSPSNPQAAFNFLLSGGP